MGTTCSICYGNIQNPENLRSMCECETGKTLHIGCLVRLGASEENRYSSILTCIGCRAIVPNDKMPERNFLFWETKAYKMISYFGGFASSGVAYYVASAGLRSLGSGFWGLFRASTTAQKIAPFAFGFIGFRLVAPLPFKIRYFTDGALTTSSLESKWQEKKASSFWISKALVSVYNYLHGTTLSVTNIDDYVRWVFPENVSIEIVCKIIISNELKKVKGRLGESPLKEAATKLIPLLDQQEIDTLGKKIGKAICASAGPLSSQLAEIPPDLIFTNKVVYQNFERAIRSELAEIFKTSFSAGLDLTAQLQIAATYALACTKNYFRTQEGNLEEVLTALQQECLNTSSPLIQELSKSLSDQDSLPVLILDHEKLAHLFSVIYNLREETFLQSCVYLNPLTLLSTPVQPLEESLLNLNVKLKIKEAIDKILVNCLIFALIKDFKLEGIHSEKDRKIIEEIQKKLTEISKNLLNQDALILQKLASKNPYFYKECCKKEASKELEEGYLLSAVDKTVLEYLDLPDTEDSLSKARIAAFYTLEYFKEDLRNSTSPESTLFGIGAEKVDPLLALLDQLQTEFQDQGSLLAQNLSKTISNNSLPELVSSLDSLIQIMTVIYLEKETQFDAVGVPEKLLGYEEE